MVNLKPTHFNKASYGNIVKGKTKLSDHDSFDTVENSMIYEVLVICCNTM